MRRLFVFLSMLLLAVPASAAKFSLAFGTHELETLDFSTRKIKDRSVWVGTYRVRDRKVRERVLPAGITADLKKKLETLIRDNRQDLSPWTRNCGGRLIYALETKREVFCVERSSALVQRRINEWIREAQVVLEVRKGQ